MKKLKIAFLSRYGDASDIAFRMSLDGHDVRLYIDDPKYRGNFEGVVRKCDTWQQATRGADLCVFDDNKLSHIWKAVHKTIPCFGGSEFSARLEDDRAFAHSIMARVGIPKLESQTFKTIPDVLKHLRECKKAHVVKPQGEKCESYHLIVGEDEDNVDAIALTERLASCGVKFDSFEVEERKFGMEVAVSGWFNGMDWVGPINLNFEHKRLHEGSLGPLCGEAGTLMRYVEDSDFPLFTETLDKMKSVLRAADFRGQIDLNMIATDEPDENGNRFFPLEFTPRLGKPSVFIEDELHITPWADLFYAIAKGEHIDLQVRYEWAIGVVLFAFGFPFEDKTPLASGGLPVFGLDTETMDSHALENIHPMQLKLEKGKFVVGNGEGYLLVATGRGKQIHEAKRAAYDAMEGVRCPNSFHVWDISDKIHLCDIERLGILPLDEVV